MANAFATEKCENGMPPPAKPHQFVCKTIKRNTSDNIVNLYTNTKQGLQVSIGRVPARSVPIDATPPDICLVTGLITAIQDGKLYQSKMAYTNCENKVAMEFPKDFNEVKTKALQ